MLAHHPKTGAPIRIITSNSSTWKSSKTIVWLDGTEETQAWNRWDVGTSSVDAWKRLTDAGTQVDVCCVLGSTDSCIEWLKAGNASSCKIIGVPQNIIETMGLQTVAEIGINNMVCMEETSTLYPFIGATWDTTEMDARTILSLILQYGRAFPIHNPREVSQYMNVLPMLLAPPPMYFITQYYVPEKKSRAKEIDRCLNMNIACKYIDKIILLNETMLELPQSEKIQQYNIGTRLRFDIVFKWIYDNAPENALICIANSDIYIDDSFNALWAVNMESVFFALLRWDEQETGEPKLFGPRADSQDTWVVSAKQVKSRKWDWETLNFPFGKGGCDNAITIEMFKQKFLVVNPCMSLITHHVHMTKYRTYDPKDIVEKPAFLYVNPTGLHDLNPIININAPVVKTFVVPSTTLEINGTLTAAQRTTLLTMLSKKEKTLTDGIIHKEYKLPIYEFDNVFELSTGLLRTYSSIIVGNTQSSAEAWSKEHVSVAAAAVPIDVGLVAHCPDEIANNPVRYLLEYMGKILALREICDGEWLGVKSQQITDALKIFRWDKDEIPVVARTQAFNTLCKKAYAWLPQDGAKAFVTPIEINALRKALINWSPSPNSKRIVLYVDGKWITDATVEMFEKVLSVSCIYPTTEISLAMNLLDGAWGAIVYGDKERWGTIWGLPVGARVWEIQPEVESSLELYQVCNASQLKHRFHIVPRATATTADLTKMVDLISKQALSESQANSKALKAIKPKIFMPDSTGFFAHAGDSFREVVSLWEERSYVDIIRVKGLAQVWLNAVGDTLLYDRPTLEWLRNAPAEEQVWKKAFFGNPAPLENSSSWSFWARRPSLVEDLVKQGVGTSDQRPLGLVFYGRSENAVQKSRRTDEWASLCDEFIHVIGEKPYPYSQRGYLTRLANAKWGLCLAGYGNKCHREIECMAMGCVPIVAKEVDMVNYKNPPVEGLHYFRAEPTDIPAILKLSHETWLKSSKACREWWKENASVDGLWKLTNG